KTLYAIKPAATKTAIKRSRNLKNFFIIMG
ncbi:MAG: hypothetical protein ACI8P3_002998, partial [Saprospiraceae bacterium]